MSLLKKYTLADVLSDKEKRKKTSLVDISADASVSEALDLLTEHNYLSAPLFGIRGRWLSAGGELNAMTATKQYIAIVSILDIVIYLTKDRHTTRTLHEDLQHTRVLDVVGQTNEGRSLWIGNPLLELSLSLEPLAKAVHRLLVPVFKAPPKHVSTHEITADSFQLCSQTDIIRFIYTHINEDESLRKYAYKSVGELGLVNQKPLVVEKNASLLSSLRILSDNNLTAVGVIESNVTPILVGTLSVSDLRSISGRIQLASLIHEMAHMTVASFLLRVKNQDLSNYKYEGVTAKKETNLLECMYLGLSSFVHRVWVVDNEGRIKGVVSFTDMIKALMSSKDQ